MAKVVLNNLQRHAAVAHPEPNGVVQRVKRSVGRGFHAGRPVDRHDQPLDRGRMKTGLTAPGGNLHEHERGPTQRSGFQP